MVILCIWIVFYRSVLWILFAHVVLQLVLIPTNHLILIVRLALVVPQALQVHQRAPVEHRQGVRVQIDKGQQQW